MATAFDKAILKKKAGVEACHVKHACVAIDWISFERKSKQKGSWLPRGGDMSYSFKKVDIAFM